MMLSGLGGVAVMRATIADSSGSAAPVVPVSVDCWFHGNLASPLRFICLGKIVQQHARAMPAALRDVLGHTALRELLGEGEAEQ